MANGRNRAEQEIKVLFEAARDVIAGTTTTAILFSAALQNAKEK
jgi:hypothetical protein